MDQFVDIHTHKSNAVEGVITPRSFGVHPWLTVSEITPIVAESFPQDALMVGECGLDKCKGGEWEYQKTVFLQQLDLAERLQKPVVVHCVRAINELLELRKSRQWNQPWVFHGFRGNKQQALQCQQMGIICSFGEALIQKNNSKIRESLVSLGIGNGAARFFLETDDSPIAIQSLYDEVASLLHLELAQLKEALFRAYHALFNR